MKKIKSVFLLTVAGFIAVSARRFGHTLRPNKGDIQLSIPHRIRRYPFLASDFWNGSYSYQVDKAKKALNDLMMEHEKLRDDYKNLEIKLRKYV
ncbi:TPA: hypothetical protein DIC20_00345 [Candidatus Dependentiae bacterium]|nr:MAG: hypothetical protein US03_C0002G0081 [candidate division TM6 bacterium GW2011_GWF2_36_131]KKQ03515.1 MAG: hypothetical protein US13_C0002G0081 [candidate division TM6 bacterium GW2011_GWE2_36_25]KKQ20211.1 MAG: hypothetical protein US32_C0001G0108 [candidate division TM6 bacterium GW2011_GWA2_36_9]HBR70751.1 hypothetical protein [Candidatus Dependentiae bacterium]HCU00136.1 hypothetical protein [Candidatus Dependentiae bacterium]